MKGLTKFTAQYDDDKLIPLCLCHKTNIKLTVKVFINLCRMESVFMDKLYK